MLLSGDTPRSLSVAAIASQGSGLGRLPCAPPRVKSALGTSDGRSQAGGERRNEGAMAGEQQPVHPASTPTMLSPRHPQPGAPWGPAWSTCTVSIASPSPLSPQRLVPSALPAGASNPSQYNLTSASFLSSVLHMYLPITGILG